MKGSGKVIYNYDDPAEFSLAIVEEQLLEDPHYQVDMKMVDTHHGDDEAWLCDEEQHEDPQEWGHWQQNSWTQHGTSYCYNPRVG